MKPTLVSRLRNAQASQKGASVTAPNSSPPVASLPGWILRKLNNPPACGTGFHPWMYHVCCLLKARNWEKDDIFAMLWPEVRRRGRPESKLHDAIEHAPGPSDKDFQRTPRLKWPKRDMQAIRTIGFTGWTLEELVAQSPVPSPRRTQVFDALYKDGCLVCCGEDKYCANTLHKEEWFGQLRRQQHIVPSPMLSVVGRNKSGKVSQRCSENTGPRRYIVLDFDFKAEDETGNPTSEQPLLNDLREEGRSVTDLCASLIGFIRGSTSFPLVLVVHSGGKSLHAWFMVEGHPEEEVREFFEMCVRYGADSVMWTPCQWARMPGGTRGNGNAQTIHFFNPQAIRK